MSPPFGTNMYGLTKTYTGAIHLAKIEVIPWNTFAQENTTQSVSYDMTAHHDTALPSIPSAPANTVHGASELWPEVLQIADWLGLGILVFAGGLWMFGNRAPAIQRIIDMAIGYEIIRHGLQLLNWLKQF